MIKGINRQIVEVTDTKNPYFERIFLVVRHQCTDCPATLLDQEAHRLFSSQKAYSGLKKARRRYWTSQMLFLLFGGIIGAVLMQAFLQL